MLDEKNRKEAEKILAGYIRERGRYPDPEEFAYILSVRLGKTVSTQEAKEIMREYFKNWVFKKFEEELSKYDFTKFYASMINVLRCTVAMYFETKDDVWLWRASNLYVIFANIMKILIEELVDRIEAMSIDLQYQEFLDNPKPFSKVCTADEYENDMVEVQNGINMLTAYFRGMNELEMAAYVNLMYFATIKVFREIRKHFD